MNITALQKQMKVAGKPAGSTCGHHSNAGKLSYVKHMKTSTRATGLLSKMLLFVAVMLGGQALQAQVTVTINSGVNVVNSGATYNIGAGSFVNNGTYTDTTSPGAFNVSGGVAFSGSGTTRTFNLNFTSGSSDLTAAQVSVYNTATLSSGVSLNAGSGNLYLRTDLHPATANLVNNGLLTGTVNGLMTYATATSGCAGYSTTLSVNVSGTSMVYQWQSSPDNITFTNVSGATSATYAFTVNSGAYYRCALSTNNTAYTQNTPSVLVTNATPSIVLANYTELNNSATSANLLYYPTTGSPTTYSIAWSGAATSAGFSTVTNASLTSTPLSISVPNGAATNTTYTGTLTVSNGTCTSTGQTIGVTRLPASGSFQVLGSAGFSAGVCQYTSIAIDGSGTPYVAYQDFGNGTKASVMKYNGTSWVQVGSAGFSAGTSNYTSLAIDGSGTPYVAYSYPGNSQQANVMKYSGSSWVQVGSAGFSAGAATNTSMAIDGSGTPFVVYGDGSNGAKASVMKYNGTSWVQVGTAGFSAGGAYNTSIAIDGSGTPYVAYEDAGNSYKASVMKYSGGSWVQVGSAGFSAGTSAGTSIAIDGSGTPYVVYQDGGNSNKASVMKYSGGSWTQVGSAGFSANDVNYTNITIDGSGTPYVTFYDNVTGKANVMKYNGTNWVQVGSAGFSAGQAPFTSIAINNSGTPYVSYMDFGNSQKVTVQKFVSGGAIAYTQTTPQALAVCQNAIATSVNSLLTTSDNLAGETLTWTVTSAPTHGTMGGFPATATSIVGNSTPTGLTYTPTNGYSGSDAFTIQVSNGTNTASMLVNVTVNPTPTVTPAPVTQSICNGASTTAITFSGAVTGTTYNWTNNATSVGLAASGSGNIAAFTATNATSAPVMAVITVTPTANSCSGTAQNDTIIVNPLPSVTLASSTSVCTGATSASLSFSGLTGGASVAAGSTTFSYTGSAQTFTVPSGVSNITFDVIGAQGAVTYNGSYSTYGGHGGRIQGSIPVTTGQTLNIYVGSTGSAYTGGYNGGGNGYLIPGVYGDYGGGGGGASDIRVGGTALTNRIVVAGGGGGDGANGLTFYNGGDGGSNTGGSSTGIETGASGGSQSAGGAGGTFAGTTSSAGVLGIGGSCTDGVSGGGGGGYYGGGSGLWGGGGGGSSYADPSATVTSNVQGYNASGNGSVTISYPATTSYTYSIVWNAAAITAGFTNVTNASWPTSGSTLSVATPSGAAPGTYTGSVTLTSGSCNSASTYPISITISAPATVDTIVSQTICNGQPSTAVTITGTGASGTVYNWTSSNTANGLSATSGSATVPSFTTTNSGITPIIDTITVTPVIPGCTATPRTFTITVNPIPTVTATPSTQSLCNGASTTAVTFSGAVTGTTYAWTNNTTSVGLAASGTGNIASFTATNTTNAAVSAIVTVTPTANGCAGATKKDTIIVNPTPNAITGTTIICNGGTTNLVETSTGGNWTSSNTAVATISSTGAVATLSTGTSVMTYSFGTGCSASVTVGVNPLPTVASATGNTTCAGVDSAVSATASSGAIINWYSAITGGTYLGTGNALTVTSPTNTTTYYAEAADSNLSPVSTVFTGLVTEPGIMFDVTPLNSITVSGFTSRCNVGTFNVEIYYKVGTLVGSESNASAWTLLTTISGSSSGSVGNRTFPLSSALNLYPGQTYAFYITGTNPGAGEVVYSVGTGLGVVIGSNADLQIKEGVAKDYPFGTTFSPRIANISVNYSKPTCSSSSRTAATLTVKPIPVVTPAPATQSVCNTAGTTAITFSSTVPGTTYAWTNNTTSVGLAASGSGNINAFTATNATTAPVTAIINVTPTANGCVGIAKNDTIIVKPTPTVTSAPTTQTLCNATSTTAITFSGAVTGTTYAWTNNTTSIGLAASGTGNIASFTATNTTNAPVSAIITVTPTANSCVGATQNDTIIVNPTPSVTTAATAITCGGTSPNIALTASVPSTFAWTVGTITGGITGASAGSGSAINQVLTNPGNTSGTVQYIVTPTSTGGTCTGAPFTITVTVKPVPTVNAVSNQAICNTTSTTAVTLTGSQVASTTYGWTNNTTSIGLAASGSGNIAAFTGVNTTALPVVATITVTPTANGCSGTPMNFTITVNPTPGVTSVPPTQTVCNNTATTALVFTNSTPGTTFYWSTNVQAIGLAFSGTGNIPSFTAVNTGTTIAQAIITVQPIYFGCMGLPQTATILVKPTPLITATPTTQTLCNNATTTAIGYTSSLTGTSFAWTNSAPSIGLAASGSGTIASFTATNTSGTTPVTALVSVTPTFGGCTGNIVVDTIVVNPTPGVTITPSSQAVCNNASSAAINFTSGVAGATYAWSNNTTSVGLGASGTGSSIGTFTATNTTTSPVTATISVTPTANTCVGLPQSATVTVNPTPTASGLPTNQTICNNTSTGAITFSGTVTGTTYAWTNNTTSIGLAASGSGNIASFTATNSGTTPVTAIVTVTPTANSCAGATQKDTIVVNPTPGVSATPTSQTVCNTATTTAISFSSLVTGTTYTWTNNNTSIGLAASGSGNIGSFTATNTGTTAVTATITVTPTANGCAGAPQTVTITVNPTPAVSIAPASQSVCNTGSTAALSFSGGVAGTTYNWTNNTTSIGLAASGTGASISSFTATNAATSSVTATITVTPTANSCIGAPQTASITVKPTPNVTATPTSQTVCNGAATTAVGFNGTVTGTTYSWTNNNTSIGLAASGSGNIASFTATNSGSAAVTAIITVTPTANGCSGTAKADTITVNPTPGVNLFSNQVTCNGQTVAAVTPTGSSVAGTTYNWTNSNTAIGLAASGTGTIPSYTGVNTGTGAIQGIITVTPVANGCSGASQFYVSIINPTPVVTVTPVTQSVCNNASTTAVAFSTTAVSYSPGPTVTTYAWTNNNTSIGLAATGSGNIASFTATDTSNAIATSAIVTVTPTVNGCVGAAQTATITVKPTPTVRATPTSQTLCNNSITTAVGFNGSVSGATYNWTNNTTSIGLAASGTSNIAPFTALNSGSTAVTAIITVTPTANGCTGSSTADTIIVNQSPAVTLASSATVCAGTTSAGLTFSGLTGGSFGGTTTTSFGYTGSSATYTVPVGATSLSIDAGGGKGGDILSGYPNGGLGGRVQATLAVTPGQVYTITVGGAGGIGVFGSVSAGGFNGGGSGGSTCEPGGGGGGATDIRFGGVALTNRILVAGGGGGGGFYYSQQISGAGGGLVGGTATVNSQFTSGPGTAATGGTQSVGGTGSTFSGQASGNNGVLGIGGNGVGLGDAGGGGGGYYGGGGGTTAGATCSYGGSSGAGGSSYTDASLTGVTHTQGFNSGNGYVYITTTVPSNYAYSIVWSTSAITAGFTNVTNASWPTSGSTLPITIPAGAAAGTYTGTVTLSNGTCNSATTYPVSITINPTPSVNAVANQSVCNGSSTTAITLTGSTAPSTVYNWTNSNTAIGLAASGSGNIAAFTATNTGTTPITSVITVTPVANGCTGTAITDTITVNPTPVLTLTPTSQTLCNNTATTAVGFNGSIVGTTFAWTNNTTSIGLAASGTLPIASFQATNTTNAPVRAVIAVTPTYNGCAGGSKTDTIIVNPTPGVTITPTTQTVCNNANSTAIAFTSGVTGTTYAWTNTTTSIGLAASGTGNIASFTAVNTGTTQVAATVTVTPTANGCAGTAQNATINVNPTPTVTATPTSQTVCNAAASTAITFSGTVTGTTYAWSNNTTGLGLAASGTTSVPSFNAINNTTAPITATITVTPTASGCVGAAQTATILVNPAPTVTITPPSQAVCNTAASAAITFSSLVSGTSTYAWTNNNTTTGLAASGTGNIASFTATNAGTTPVTSTITVTPSANGCTGVSQTATVTVNPTPTVLLATTKQNVCNNTVNSVIAFSSTVLGTTYAWTNSNTTIGLLPSGTGNVPSFTATNPTTAPVIAVITVTPTANSCAGAAKTDTIVVNPTPGVTINPTSQAVCNNAGTTAIGFTGAVAGTTYAWTNSPTSIGLAASGSGNIASFTATNTGTAPVTATINVTPSANGCNGPVQTATIVVNPTPVVVMTPVKQSVCNTATSLPVVLTSAVAGTTYTWTNANNAVGLGTSGSGNVPTFTAINTGTAPITVLVNVTPLANSCVGATQVDTIIVNPTPIVAATPASQTVCNTSNSSAIAFSSAVVGTTYAWTNNTTSVGLGASGAGSIPTFVAANTGNTPVTATITVTPTANSCVGAAQTATVTVTPSPVMTITPAAQAVCNGAVSVPLTFNSTQTGTTYTWSNNNPAIGLGANGFNTVPAFVAHNTGSTPISGTITAVPYANSCFGLPVTATITVNPTPPSILTASANTTSCTNDSVTMTANSGSGYSYSWLLNGAAVPGGTGGTYYAHTSGNYAVVVSALGCKDTSAVHSVQLNAIPPTPINNILGNLAHCQGDSVVLATVTSTTQNYVYQWLFNGGAIGGATLPVYTAMPAGAYSVRVTSGICTGTSAALNVVVNPLPNNVSVIAPDTVICAESTMQIYVDSTFNVPASYQWFRNGYAAAGKINASYPVTNGGYYSVTVTNQFGCSYTTPALQIHNGVAPTPVIISTGTQLCVQGAGYVTYNWYLNGVLQSQHGSCITPATGGSYTVTVTNVHGCAGTSAPFKLNTGVVNVTAEDISLFPNPATSVVHIKAPEQVNVSVCGLDGKQIMYEKDATSIDISKLANAVYMFKIYDKNNNLVKIEKLVKTGW